MHSDVHVVNNLGDRRFVHIKFQDSAVSMVDPGVDGRIILRWIFRKWDVEVRTGSIWLRIGTRGGHL